MASTFATAVSSKGSQAKPQTPSLAWATTPPPHSTRAATCNSDSVTPKKRPSLHEAKAACTASFCAATLAAAVRRSVSTRKAKSGSAMASICAAR